MSLLGVKVRGRSQLAVEACAARAREKVAFDAGATDALDCLKVFGGLRRTLGVQYEIQERGHEACVFVDANTKQLVVCVSSSTYDGLEQNDARAAFTVCHEIGHVVMHEAELRAASREPALFARERQHRIFEDSEWQANCFAAAMLMPGRGLLALASRGELDVWLLQETFDVSAQAAAKRLADFRANKVLL
jgi:predicted transcriptional regulator